MSDKPLRAPFPWFGGNDMTDLQTIRCIRAATRETHCSQSCEPDDVLFETLHDAVQHAEEKRALVPCLDCLEAACKALITNLEERMCDSFATAADVDAAYEMGRR